MHKLAVTLPRLPVWLTRIVLWTLLIIFVAANMIIKTKIKDSVMPYGITLLKTPFSSSVHMRVASQLWEQGQKEEAKRELSLAQDLITPRESAVLGTVHSPSELLGQWEREPELLEKKFMYWKNVTSVNPDYRDAFVAAGALAYELGNSAEAKRLLKIAQNLDPNFRVTRDLLSSLAP